MVFHWNLNDNNSPKVSRTLLSILADLINAVVWIVSTRSFISKSSSPCINYHYYYYLLHESFSQLIVFHWSLSNSKSPKVSRTLLSILAILNNVVVWMVSTRPRTFKSSSPFNNPLVTVPKAPITIGIIVTFMFLSFFNSLARSKYLSFFSISFSFILWSAGTVKSTILQILFFFVHLLLLFTPLEFFTSVLADGFSLEFEWQQVSSSLQDLSQDSGHS